VVVLALEFNVPKGAVAEYVAADAHIRLVLGEDAGGRYSEEFLKFRLTDG